MILKPLILDEEGPVLNLADLVGTSGDSNNEGGDGVHLASRDEA